MAVHTRFYSKPSLNPHPIFGVLENNRREDSGVASGTLGLSTKYMVGRVTFHGLPKDHFSQIFEPSAS